MRSTTTHGLPAERIVHAAPWVDRHRPSAAHLLLAILIGSALQAAEDTGPLVELTYRAIDGITPPAPLSTWWSESIGDAAAWWSTASGVSVDAHEALTGLQSLHVLAGGVPAPDGQLTPTFAGWLREGAPMLAPSLVVLPTWWPGFVATPFAGGVTLCGPHGTAPAINDPPSGIRVLLHGPALAEELRRRSSKRTPSSTPTSDDLADFLKGVVAQWQPCAGLEPGPVGASGWLDTGLSSRWFAAVDHSVVAALPADTVAWLAIGVNGQAFGEDFQKALADQGLATVWPFSWFPLLDPTYIGMALTGTWLCADTPQGLLIRVPRSVVLDSLAAGLGTSLKLHIPEDQHAVDLVDGLQWARAPHEWILGTSAEAIASWFDRSPRLIAEVPATAVLVGHVDRSATSSTITPGLLWEEPLPVRAWPPSHFNHDAQELHRTMSNAWPAMASALDQAGDHHGIGSDHDGQLRISLTGPVLPWLIPGLAIRWFADVAQDEEGKRHLRNAMRHLAATGQAVTQADARATLPHLESAQLAAWTTLVTSLAISAISDNPAEDVARLRTASVPWPVAPADRRILDQAPQLLEATALLDDPTLPHGGILGELIDRDQPGFQSRWFATRLAGARTLTAIGLRMACHGLPAGVILADRATTIVDQPYDLATDVERGKDAILRDGAWLISLVAGAAHRPAVDHWLAEPPPPVFSPTVWRSMRIDAATLVGEPWMSQGMLDSGQPGEPALHAVPRRLAFFLGHRIRAYTAQDVAVQMQVAERLEHQQPLSWSDMENQHSPLAASMIPIYQIAHLQERGQFRQAVHVLVRTAARLQLLNQDGKLPLRQEDAVAAIGALVCPYGDALLPLTYQRLADNAFRLFVADRVPAPPGIAAERWTSRLAALEAPAGVHLVLPTQVLEVLIDPRVPPAPKIGSNDF